VVDGDVIYVTAWHVLKDAHHFFVPCRVLRVVVVVGYVCAVFVVIVVVGRVVCRAVFVQVGDYVVRADGRAGGEGYVVMISFD
jgi:hypothetical protein